LKSTDTVNKVVLRKTFSNLKVTPGNTMPQYLADTFLLQDTLGSADEQVSDAPVFFCLLHGFP
jgi:hypothetical protein